MRRAGSGAKLPGAIEKANPSRGGDAKPGTFSMRQPVVEGSASETDIPTSVIRSGTDGAPRRRRLGAGGQLLRRLRLVRHGPLVQGEPYARAQLPGSGQ